MRSSKEIIEQTKRYTVANYDPLPVVIENGLGTKVWDVEGKEYLDFLGAYSAVSFGHSHPRLLKVLKEQADKILVTSRAVYTDNLGEYCKMLAGFCLTDKVLPMNTGAEAVETAIKVARKWGYLRKGVQENKAHIIVCDDNFHGRTTTLCGFSTVNQYSEHFGPFSAGFTNIPFNNSGALKESIDKNTVAFLVESIQGEGGVRIPSQDYLKECKLICQRNNILFIADEVQTGFGRTGHPFGCWTFGVVPDIYILGKALGGGIASSAIALNNEIIDGIINPGDHGSTFGGNPLACAMGIEAMNIFKDESLDDLAYYSGNYMLRMLINENEHHPCIKDIRGVGLLIGIEMDSEETVDRTRIKLLNEGLICGKAHNVLRLSPPLTVSREEIDTALYMIKKALST
jgi:ornithine--oxo-acid transaminase